VGQRVVVPFEQWRVLMKMRVLIVVLVLGLVEQLDGQQDEHLLFVVAF